MVQNLTQQDIDHLQGLVGNSYAEEVGNRDAYYSYLEESRYKYGGLAGDLPFSSSGGALLFHLLSKLYERTSVIITTNLSFSE